MVLYEPIIIARKPFKGSLVDNLDKYGVGGINIDECRVGSEVIKGGTMPDFRDIGQKSKEAIGIDKLMVDVHGNFYACEKTNTNYCLGNVNDGINKEKVIRYFEFLKDIQQNRCNYCPIRNLCDVCIKTVDVNNDEFNIKKERCDETVIRFTSLLKLYCYSKEKGYF